MFYITILSGFSLTHKFREHGIRQLTLIDILFVTQAIVVILIDYDFSVITIDYALVCFLSRSEQLVADQEPVGRLL